MALNESGMMINSTGQLVTAPAPTATPVATTATPSTPVANSGGTSNTSYPVDTSSFTPSQLAAYNYALSLVPTSSSNNNGASAQTTSPSGNAYNAPPAPSTTTNPNANYTAGVLQTAPQGTQLNTNPSSNPTGGLITQNSNSSVYSPSNTPQTVAANISPSGLEENNIGMTQTELQTQITNAQNIISSNTDTLNKVQQELESITAGPSGGTASDYEGRVATLQNIIQSTQSNINAANANLSTYQSQASGALSGALTANTQLQASPYGTPQVITATGTTYSGGQNTTPGMLNSSTGVGASGTATLGIQPSDPLYPQVQYWAQQVADGLPVSSLPAPFNNGVVQTQIQQMAATLPSSSGSSYNPVSTSQNVQGAINQNISTGTGFAGQAATVSNILNNISSLSPQIQNFMVANKINNQSGLPIINGPILTYLQNSNPGAASSWTQYVNELNNYASQILATKGITPTGSESQLASLNLSTLTSGQLSTFLQTLNNVGNSYYTQLSNSANKALQTNNQPGTLYTGNTAAPTPLTVTTPVATPNASANNPTWIQFGSGLVQDAVNSVGGAVAGLAGLAASIFSAL